jgi:hypothetical protein
MMAAGIRAAENRCAMFCAAPADVVDSESADCTAASARGIVSQAVMRDNSFPGCRSPLALLFTLGYLAALQAAVNARKFVHGFRVVFAVVARTDVGAGLAPDSPPARPSCMVSEVCEHFDVTAFRAAFAVQFIHTPDVIT